MATGGRTVGSPHIVNLCESSNETRATTLSSGRSWKQRHDLAPSGFWRQLSITETGTDILNARKFTHLPMASSVFVRVRHYS
jgi:hypothetical protein